MHRKILWNCFSSSPFKMRHVALKGYLGCEKLALQELGWHQEMLHMCEKLLGNRFCFCFAKWIHAGKTGSNRNPLSGTCLMSGKRRGHSRHTVHQNPCRCWNTVQLSCPPHWALWVILKRLVHSLHTSHVVWREGLQRVPFFPCDPTYLPALKVSTKLILIYCLQIPNL